MIFTDYRVFIATIQFVKELQHLLIECSLSLFTLIEATHLDEQVMFEWGFGEWMCYIQIVQGELERSLI